MSEQLALPRSADVLLADGRIAAIRPMIAADRDGLMALHDAAGDESLRLRFFALNREALPPVRRPPGRQSGDTVATLVATIGGTIVAVATAERVSPDVAEAAFLVSDAEHRHGLGGLLLEHLAAACRDVGIRRFVADVLPDNTSMIRVFRDAGFTLSNRSEPGVVLVEMSTEAIGRGRRGRGSPRGRVRGAVARSALPPAHGGGRGRTPRRGRAGSCRAHLHPRGRLHRRRLRRAPRARLDRRRDEPCPT